MTTTARTASSAPRRLAAAVLGAGLLAGSLAAPALAVGPGAPPAGGDVVGAWWTPDHGIRSGYFLVDGREDVTTAVFQTYEGYDPADLAVGVQAIDAAGDPVGQRVTVPFTAVPTVDGGIVDVLATRRALGEAGTGPVRYTVSDARGELHFHMDLAADADLSDTAGSAVTALVNPQERLADSAPLAWSSDVVVAPGVQAIAIDQQVTTEGHPVVVKEPSHGELYVYGTRGQTAVYIPKAGFTGTDTFTVDFHGDKVAAVQTVTVHVGRALTAEEKLFDGGDTGVLGAQALHLDDQETARLIADLRARPEVGRVQPATPSPSTSASPSTPAPTSSAPATTAPATPAPSAPSTTAPSAPSTSAPAVSASSTSATPSAAATEGAHDVPTKVQTGEGVPGVLLALAGAAAAALLVLRRRLGLAR